MTRSAAFQHCGGLAFSFWTRTTAQCPKNLSDTEKEPQMAEYAPYATTCILREFSFMLPVLKHGHFISLQPRGAEESFIEYAQQGRSHIQLSRQRGMSFLFTE
ncbi:hypothetical protein C2857_002005 [Epichloe festucae Fl1]|uniref:Uncharacterized protein n=1 Tax=Epichloe festucae (strain Fl1) TaxID=877507 RepID=A0A7S9KUF7_EPIFF|nr:hypothetical protein C2857_002005 [Epichloe festucae Fl1]